MTPPTLPEFILARVGEMEMAARKAARFRYDRPQDAPWESAAIHVARGAALSSEPHIALNSPARVLAQCAAIRAVVDMFMEDLSVSAAEVVNEGGVPSGIGETLAILATIWADSPDYRKEWAA